MKRKSGSFLVEASIISLSNFTVKIIGVLYKIPLSNLLQGGMGAFTAAYSVYAMLYMISTAGLPVATSRMVAASAKKGRPNEVKRIFKLCMLMFGIVGFLFAAAMFIFAEDIAVSSKHSDSVYAMRVIAPTLFTICIVSAVRGYMQGLRNMVPTAVSQFIEAFFKLAIGLGLAYWSNRRGDPVAVQAAYAILGITVGIAIGMVYLLLYKKFSKKQEVEPLDDGSDSTKQLAKRLVLIALPITVTSSALYLCNFIDTLVIKKALISGGVSEAMAGGFYTAYTTLSTGVAELLPSTLVFPIAISILPAISGALAAKNEKEAKDYIHSSLRITGLIALPCASLLFVLARPAISLLYGSTWGSASGPLVFADGTQLSSVDMASNALSILAVGIFFISLLSTTNALLQAIGKSHYPMISVCSGVAVLIFAEILTVSSSKIGIYGAPVSSLLCYITAYLLNVCFLKKCGISGVSPIKLYVKPAVAAILAGGVAYAVYALLPLLISGDGRMENLVFLGISGVLGACTYATVLLLIKGITLAEIKLLPLGERIAGFLLRKNLIK